MIRKFIRYAREDNAVRRVIDGAWTLPTAISALHLYSLKRFELKNLPLNRKVLDKIGLHPIIEHYYEPFVSERTFRHSTSQPRDLPGVDLRRDEARDLLERLSAYRAEPLQGPVGSGELQYVYDNGTYGGFDGAVLYGLVRELSPRRIVEVGCGNSTLVVERALEKNREVGDDCEHVSIEPYEMPWLEQLDIELIRSKVEEVGVKWFASLETGDVLFIDTSHVIRPQGEVLYLVQEVLPRLKSGVWVHVHDIFTPYEYPETWFLEKKLLWNEQYLLEAFLAFNEKFEIMLPSYCMYREQRSLWGELRENLSLPFDEHPPSSFWLRSR